MKFLLLIVTFYCISVSVYGKDQSSPESTLKGYLNCFEIADEACVLKYYYGINSFYTGKPHTTEFKITKKIVYAAKDVETWNSAGITPLALVGDISLDVLQKTDTDEFMYSYSFRKYGNKWLIYSHTVWGLDAE